LAGDQLADLEQAHAEPQSGADRLEHLEPDQFGRQAMDGRLGHTGASGQVGDAELAVIGVEGGKERYAPFENRCRGLVPLSGTHALQDDLRERHRRDTQP
jgi:hypothetical protein